MPNNKRDRDRTFTSTPNTVLTMDNLAALGYSFDTHEESGLVVAADRTLMFRGFVFKATYAVVPADASEEDYREVFGLLKPIIGASNFWLGDTLNGAEAAHGEKYTEASDLTGLEEKTLRNIASVCRNVEMSLRRDKLTFKHHVIVAALDAERQRYWLDRAVEEGLSANKLRLLINGKADPDWRKLLPDSIREVDKEIGILMQSFATKQPINADRLKRLENMIRALWMEITTAQVQPNDVD